jgi:hypothetical protein
MNKSVFQPLVVLEKKPISLKFEEVRVMLPQPKKDGEPESPLSTLSTLGTLEEGEEREPYVAKTFVKIVDKRKTSNVDRTAVLRRLREQMVVKNTLDLSVTTTMPIEDMQYGEPSERSLEKEQLVIIEPPEVVAIKTGQKLVIKPKLVIKEANKEVLERLPEAVVEQADVVPDKPKRGRKPKAQKDMLDEPIGEVDLTTATIRNQKVADRLPKEREKIIIKAPTYYMNNRKLFIQRLTELFKPYQKELLESQESVSCESRSENFDLITHQKIVRDYLNLYTPYRGLLLYHGLGSGKTCTSIAIAEGMKSNKRVFVLTPASLKMNFFSEMKKCGDDLYKKNQFWEFVSIEGKPEYLGILSRALSLPVEYVRKQNGAWLVNVSKESNYTELESTQQLDIDAQLNQMIRSKYTDINYNGLNANKIKMLTNNYTINPFDNSVVVIDEAHNFVSRIVNKIKKPKSISFMLYDYLMNASNCRVVLLSGTPIINYPNEIGILYNILRGYIKTWTIPAVWEKAEKLNTETILKMLDDGGLKTYDYVDFADNKITITRNPFGFINTKKRGALKGTQRNKGQAGGQGRGTKKSRSLLGAFIVGPTVEMDEISESEDAAVQEDKNEELKDLYSGGSGSDVFDRYNGVQLDETGNLTDDDFINRIQAILKSAKNGIKIRGQIELNKYKALPDNAESFLNMFVDEESGNAKNIDLFQRRILGLTSYFRSAQEQLLPSFIKTPQGDTYYVEKCEMTSHQYGAYEKIRKEEADREKQNKKQMRNRKPVPEGEDIYNISSTYRIFSRAACNFAFPPDIERPLPNPRTTLDDEQDQEVNELDFDAVPKELRQDVDIYSVGEDQEDVDSVALADAGASEDMTKYEKRIERALQDLNKKVENTNDYKYLSKDALPMYSPKFAKVLENLTNPENDGLHLIYSHFRTIEGIGILRLILMANGFAEFKLQKTGETWDIVESIEDEGKPRFVLYTGTETADEKEIIRNIYNGMWDFVPGNIVSKLKAKAENNNYGEIIKIFMITSSGAEGINLRNTRFVHIIEPYWHMVRVDQVVGRARRICSHQDLPEDKRTVKVFLYVSTFTEAQKTDEKNIELRIRDVSRLDKKTPVTTDESLYEIASVKQRINNQILRAVKESAVDCNIYSVLSKKDDPNSEKLVCYGFGKVESNQFSSYPTLERDQSEKSGLDIKRVEWTATKVSIGGVDYALNQRTNELYDYASYQRATEMGSELILIGRLVKDAKGTKIVKV